MSWTHLIKNDGFAAWSDIDASKRRVSQRGSLGMDRLKAESEPLRKLSGGCEHVARLYKRMIRTALWVLVGVYESETDAQKAMVALPVEPCDYLVTRKELSQPATLELRKAA